MTDVEDRLRHDLRKRAERAQPGSIRPLRIPPATRRSKARYWLASARRSKTARLVAPATAMVAVIGIIAGVWMAGHPTGNRPAAAGSSAGMPKYYVTLSTVLTGRPVRVNGFTLAGTGPGSVAAIVRDSLTGARLDTVLVLRVGRGENWPQSATWITAAANDRVFAIGAGSHAYILRLRLDGKVEGLSPLPAAMSKTISGSGHLAVLSPAGTELAFTNWTDDQLTVVTLATGATRTWRARPGFVNALQWPGIGNKVFVLSGGQPGLPTEQFRLLDVGGAGGSVLADSRLVYSPPPFIRDGYVIAAPMITPSGNLLFLAHSVYTKRGGVETTACRVVEFSSGARRLLRVLYRAHAPSSTVGFFPPCGVVSVGPKGLNLLIEDFGYGRGYGRLDGSRITALPGWAADDQWPQAAW
jgi:hypothetical protein